ncbi:hypothetical protein, partial [Levilactobacillus lindianensis]|uniref:hypothetical protein n=1 Tax=Levilactobacillus lindianensis TaxID=2486018 RepID=UPI001CDD0AA7
PKSWSGEIRRFLSTSFHFGDLCHSLFLRSEQLQSKLAVKGRHFHLKTTVTLVNSEIGGIQWGLDQT